MRKREMKKPRGLSRALFRAPIWLYKLGLGFLLGERFICIEHVGRVSGNAHQTVIEVVSKDEESGAYYVASAWGEQADWLLNLQKRPACTAQVGRRRFAARAERISKDGAERVILDYATRHPGAMRGLASFMGFEVDGSEESYRQMAPQLPIMRIAPVSPESS